MGVLGEKERAGDALCFAVVADGLGDGGDVIVIEGGEEGVAAVTGGSEGDALGGYGGVGVQGVVGSDEAGNIDEVGGEWGLAGSVGLLSAHELNVLVTGSADLCNIWDGSGRRKWLEWGSLLSYAKKLVLWQEFAYNGRAPSFCF